MTLNGLCFKQHVLLEPATKKERRDKLRPTHTISDGNVGERFYSFWQLKVYAYIRGAGGALDRGCTVPNDIGVVENGKFKLFRWILLRKFRTLFSHRDYFQVNAP